MYKAKGKTFLDHTDVHDKCELLAQYIEKVVGCPLKIYPVPRGGIPVAYVMQKFMVCSIVNNPEEADIILDDLIDSGRTKQKFEDEYPNIPFYALYEKMPGNDWLVFPWESTAEKSIEDAFTRILQFANEDPSREGLRETPARAAKAWEFWTSGYHLDPKAVFKQKAGKLGFEDGGEDYNEMVIVSPIPFFSHCEHHLAAIFGTVYIGYIPNGKIAGLSKFPRLVDVFARRLQVQERLTTQIANTIQEVLEPKGVAVFVKARHFCMESRGVQKPGVETKTSALRGILLESNAARAEFFNLLDK